MDLPIILNYTIHLINCSLSNKRPTQLPDNINLKDLFSFCVYHKIENIVYYALDKLELSKVDMQAFEKYHMLAIVRDANQDAALSDIMAEFNKNEIGFMTLKGSVIKHIYPLPDMRQSADIDIYINESQAVAAKKIMVAMGFHTNEALFGLDADDAYELGPYLRVELHRMLLSDIYKWKEASSLIEKNIFRVGDGFEYKMTDEDFYIYMIIHIAKHMHISGMGIKAILDVWVYLKHYCKNLNKKYLQSSLKKCGLDRFEKNIRLLAYKWFGEEKIENQTIEKLALYVASVGWVGTSENREFKYWAGNYANNNKTDKFKYYKDCVFLEYNRMCKEYPILIKNKYLLPLFWGIRLVKIALFRRERIGNIVDKVQETSKYIEQGKKLIEFDKEIGL